MQRKTSISPLAVALVAASAFLAIGVMTFARPCGVHDDGSVSSCFWAGRAILGVAVAATVLSVARLVVRDAGMARGLDVSVAVLGVLAAAVPGGLIDLCMMQTMRCHQVMRPFTLVVGSVMVVLAVIDLVVSSRQRAV